MSKYFNLINLGNNQEKHSLMQKLLENKRNKDNLKEKAMVNLKNHKYNNIIILKDQK